MPAESNSPLRKEAEKRVDHAKSVLTRKLGESVKARWQKRLRDAEMKLKTLS
jgi:hypothetical protein